MNSTYISIFLLAFLGSVAGLAGGLFLLWKEKIVKKLSIYLISFAAGVMLAASLIDLLPEAIEHGGDNVFVLVLAGLTAFVLVENILLHFHHHEGHEHKNLRTAAPLIVIGDSIHNFVDGAVIAASFLVDHRLGLIVALATFFHEVPQEIGDFAVLLSTGMKKTRVLGANLLSAAATFLGAGLTVAFAETTQGILGSLLALASGMFLYIATADILPELVHATPRKLRVYTMALFLAGMCVIYVMTQFD